MRALVMIALLAACSDEAAAPRLVSAAPDHGPLVGGTTIVLTGSGFDRGAPVRVLIGGREAPLALATGDTTLEVVIPPGDRTGEAEIIVLAERATGSAAHLFHYSVPPAIETVSPAEVVWDSTTTTMTVTGHGFLDEASGELAVLVDGTVAADVIVRSDTTLTFSAPPGTAFVQPDVQVLDLRGSATKARSFRYRPGPRGGLVMFSRFGAAFLTFFDPVDGSSFAIPRAPSSASSFTTVVLDQAGSYWAFDRSQRWGRIDMLTQELVAPIQTNWLIPTMVRMGSTYYA
ncbi:MAG: IPT/TIG domain-containing protein, partial [Polyangiales bacterium]